ncbi:MAG TPA: hypothetical protein VJB90_03875 [Candidatus Nanoarchaeia archaeon]|nr:hypothetical protein [Candidatus Nanoarchaeia archaeon]
MTINIVVGGEYRLVEHFIAFPRRTVRPIEDQDLVERLRKAGISPAGKVVYEPNPSSVYALSPFKYNWYSRPFLRPGENAPRVYRVQHLDTEIFGREVLPFSDEYMRIMKWIGLGNCCRNLLDGQSSAVLPPDYLAIAPLFSAALTQ